MGQRDGEGIVAITARPEMDDRRHRGFMWPTKLHTYMAKKKKKTERRTGEKARKYEWSEKGNGNTMV